MKEISRDLHIQMDSFITGWLYCECKLTSYQIQRILSSLTIHEDVKYELYNTLITGHFPELNAIKVCNYTAETIFNSVQQTEYQFAPAVLVAYRFLIHLRENESVALNDFKNGIPLRWFNTVKDNLRQYISPKVSGVMSACTWINTSANVKDVLYDPEYISLTMGEPIIVTELDTEVYELYTNTQKHLIDTISIHGSYNGTKCTITVDLRTFIISISLLDASLFYDLEVILNLTR